MVTFLDKYCSGWESATYVEITVEALTAESAVSLHSGNGLQVPEAFGNDGEYMSYNYISVVCHMAGGPSRLQKVQTGSTSDSHARRSHV